MLHIHDSGVVILLVSDCGILQSKFVVETLSPLFVQSIATVCGYMHNMLIDSLLKHSFKD